MIESQIFTPISLSSAGVKAALNEGVAIISDIQTSFPFSREDQSLIEVVQDIFVHNSLLDTITDTYLNTSINNMSVYAVHNRLYFGLPSNGIKFVILESSDQNMIIKDDLRYYKINFDIENTISWLYSNAWMYSFNYIKQCYEKLDFPRAVEQLFKPVVSKRLLRLFGHSEDRIADYGRIILFLLSKVHLTEEELEIFAPLLECVPNVSSIQPVITRETQLQNELLQIKQDPIGFINLF